MSFLRAMNQKGVGKDCKAVIDVSWGDAHNGGLKPLTFARQVMAACFYPALLSHDKLPADARERARSLLNEFEGGSLGSYTDTGGLYKIQRNVCDFITRRDRGLPSFPENVFITTGSQWALTTMLTMLVSSEGSVRTGILTPVPNYALFNLALSTKGALMVPYQLCEERGWSLQVEELQRVIQDARGRCNPMALYIINPGNPTGHMQSRKSIEEVIRFAAEEKLFLLADEVYQDSVHEDGCEFVSYKQVLSEMGPPFDQSVELASFHSASKGIMGECGLRGGYVELVNLDPKVMERAFTLFSASSCASVVGQIALDIMVDPPKPGQPSYPLFAQEVQCIKNTILNNIHRVHKVLDGLPGISYQPVKGGTFIFPQLLLPSRAIEEAKEAGMEPDRLYCERLLEEAGLRVGPGCDFGQKEGTHHIRFTLAVKEDVMEEVLRRLSGFHLSFMSHF